MKKYGFFGSVRSYNNYSYYSYIFWKMFRWQGGLPITGLECWRIGVLESGVLGCWRNLDRRV
jgi:hypothetical protein